jgi:lipopolysaccharide transport system ATP-binding protein
MGAVRNLCSKGILMKNGQCVALGSSAEVLDEYSNQTSTIQATTSLADRPRSRPTKGIKITNVQLINCRSGLFCEAETYDNIEIVISYDVIGPVKYFSAEWVFRDINGGPIAHSSSSPIGHVLYQPTGTAGQVRCTIPKIPFTVGQYRLDVGFAVPNVEFLDFVEEAALLTIISCDPEKSGNQIRYDRAPVYIGGVWS